MASQILMLLENMYRAGAAKTAVAPNSWAVISLWRRLFQLREEESERSVEAMVSAIEEVVKDREDCPIACEEVAEARREFVRDYYRRILHPTAAGHPGLACSSDRANADVGSTNHRNELASLLEQAQEAQEARVRRNQPILSIPTQDVEGRGLPGHLHLEQ